MKGKRGKFVKWYERKLKCVKICEKLKSVGKVAANMVQSSLFLTLRVREWRTDWLPLFNKIVNHIFIQKSSHFIIDSMESLSGCSDAPCAQFFFKRQARGARAIGFLMWWFTVVYTQPCSIECVVSLLQLIVLCEFVCWMCEIITAWSLVRDKQNNDRMQFYFILCQGCVWS